MSKEIEQKIYGIILSWLETHEIGNACNEAIAKKLAQRIDTRLDRAGVLNQPEQPGQPGRG